MTSLISPAMTRDDRGFADLPRHAKPPFYRCRLPSRRGRYCLRDFVSEVEPFDDAVFIDIVVIDGSIPLNGLDRRLA